MTRKIKIAIALILVTATAGAAIWLISERRAAGRSSLTTLTAEELRLVLASQAETAEPVTPDPETRRRLIAGLREYLALAAAAKDEALDSDKEFQINFGYKRNILLADLYRAKLAREGDPKYTVPEEAMKAVWSEPANEAAFERDIAAMQTIQQEVARERGETYAVQKLQAGALDKARDNWARTKVLSDKALADREFMSQPVVELRTRILEAGILSTDYLRKHWSSIRATDAEKLAYLQKHPEFDVAKKRAKAEELLRSIKAGANFEELVARHSEDRGSKPRGGAFEKITPGTIWPEVEQAAMNVAPGTLVDRIVESELGFHIVKLEAKKETKGADGQTTSAMTIRHILLQRRFEDPQNLDPNLPSPFLTPDEIARSAVEKEKRESFIAAVLKKYEIVLPEDFA